MALLHSNILGSGPDMLILHGFLGLGDNWKSLGMQFAKNYQVHLIDQRNHGRSFHTEDFSYELMVEDLLYYMDHHQIQQAHVLGHSMGGKTAMLFSVEHPERVQSLIVADISPRFYPPHHQSIIEALEEVDFSKIKNRQEIVVVFQRHISDSGIRQFRLKNVYKKDSDRYASRFNLEALEEHIEEVGVSLPPRSMFDRKTLFLKGQYSGYITSDDEALILAHFPESQIVVISNAGHWLHAENPKDFYQAVMLFLENE